MVSYARHPFMHRNLFTWQKALVLLICLEASADIPCPRRPHIVFFLADDLGYHDVSYHGSKQIPTPNVDSLARDGISLNQYYTQPICSPTRAALLTGKYPIRLGFQDYVIKDESPWGLPLCEKTLPQYFKELDYSTHIVGKWHLGFFQEEYIPLRRGFDSFFGYYNGFEDYFTHESNFTYSGLDLHDNYENAFGYKGKYGPDLFTQKATEIIFNHDPSKPLFLYVAQQAVHIANFFSDPLQTTRKYFDPLSSIKDRNRRIYAGMVSSMDNSVGEVFAALDQSGMLDNTIFVFASDNGSPTAAMEETRGSNFPLRGAKSSLFEGGVRVPAFIWSPQLRQVSRVHNHLVHVTDWLPTLLAAAGGYQALSFLRGIDGVNQWPSFASLIPSCRSDILLNINPINGQEAAYRSGRFKIIKGSYENGAVGGWYGTKGYPIVNGNVSYPTPGEIEEYDKIYKQFLQRSKVADILERKYGKDRNELLKCDTPSCRENIVDCKLPRPLTDNCKPENQTCLYDVINDPCEFYNIAESRPEIVEELEQHMALYRSVMVPPFTNFEDPMSNPKLHGNVWIPWRWDPRQ